MLVFLLRNKPRYFLYQIFLTWLASDNIPDQFKYMYASEWDLIIYI